jgi:D-sedoheptulose 7-phosphate isomerase
MKAFIRSYLAEVQRLLGKCDSETLERVFGVLQQARRDGRRIFVAGNGGSAATANHFTCDLGKNTAHGESERFRIISLCDNIPYLTAYANDTGYSETFFEQAKNLMEPGDVLVVISVSGSSPNIVRVADYFKQRSGIVIAMTGPTGGDVKRYADYHLPVASDSYEQVEDLHVVFAHVIVAGFRSLARQRAEEPPPPTKRKDPRRGGRGGS